MRGRCRQLVGGLGFRVLGFRVQGIKDCASAVVVSFATAMRFQCLSEKSLIVEGLRVGATSSSAGKPGCFQPISVPAIPICSKFNGNYP